MTRLCIVAQARCTAESNHGRRRKSSLSVKQADLTGGSTSSPVVSAKHLIPSCAYFCRSCCRGTNKQKLAQRNNHDGPLQAVKLVSKKPNTQYVISNPIVDDRLTFLAFCGGNHLQFDTLRHAKYSSMLVLRIFRITRMRENVRSILQRCRMPIVNGHRWQCDTCPSFDLCSSCVSQHRTSHSHDHELHEHPLRCVKVTDRAGTSGASQSAMMGGKIADGMYLFVNFNCILKRSQKNATLVRDVMPLLCSSLWL